jgi:hypothetical protein
MSNLLSLDDLLQQFSRRLTMTWSIDSTTGRPLCQWIAAPKRRPQIEAVRDDRAVISLHAKRVPVSVASA